MPIASGVDGCRAGWICVSRDLATGLLENHCPASAAELFALSPKPDLLAIDIPIGLQERDPRECDRAARKVLGRPRASSVFPAPLRPVLEADTWEEACRISEAHSGKRVSKQAWAITGKVSEVDRELRAHPELRRWVREVHPEVSFRAWVGFPMRYRKSRRPGRDERRRLVDAYFGPTAFDQVRDGYMVKHVGHDDILDAFAALWTAERVLRGEARTLPKNPPRDACGLPMEILY